jgi:transcriptional regulator with XRE-family HTH domain
MLRSGIGDLSDWQAELGRAVRARRQELELTLDEASTDIKISRSHLNLIELGKASGVSHDCVAKIDEGLAADGKLLTMLATRESANPARDQHMQRGEFNKALFAFAAALLLDPDRLAGTQAVDPPLLHDLQSLTADFVRRHHYARPQVIVRPVRAHLLSLLDLGRASIPPALRPALARTTAETAAIAGWVVFRGHGDLVNAHAHLALARQFAREAGDDTLMAQVLAASSSLYSSLDIPRGERQRSSPLALSLLRAAQRKARTGPAQLHGWLAARIAAEQALRGDGHKARAGLTRAEATLPSCPQRDPGGLFCMWDETRLPGYAGKTLLILGDPAATKLLEQALAVTDAPHPRLGVLIDLAAARLRDEHADAAVALLIDAAQLAVKHGIDGFARWRLQEGRAALPSAQRRVFDQRLHALA